MSLQATDNRDLGKVTAEGLVKGHAYAITETDKVSITNDNRNNTEAVNVNLSG